MTTSALNISTTIPFKNGLKTLFSRINATNRFSFLSIEAQKQFLKIVLIFISFIGGNQFVLGQTAGNYLFTASSGTFTPLSWPSTLTFAGSGNERFMDTPISIGFTFKFENTNYTTFAVSENGWMTLGKAATNASFNWLASGTERPTIAPLYDDLKSNRPSISNQTGDGSITYQLTGASPNRILTLQWLKFLWNWNASSPSLSFQVKLYETTNKIEFIYQAESGTVNIGSASIGIAGVSTGSGNYLSLNNTSANPTASSSNETTNINVKPATGQTYTFTPPPVITSSPASITSLDYCLGSGPSSSQSFTVSGINLTTNITVTAPVGFEVSKDNTTFASAISFTPSSLGIVSSSTVFVRTQSGLTAGAKSGTLACTSTNASTQNISLSGTIKASVGGTVSGGGGSPLCPGSNSNTLTLNGSTGAIQWQSSSVSDFSSSVTDISGATSATYTATNIATTTYYRAKLTDGSCASAYSNTVVITTMAITASASPICGGQDLTLSTNIPSGSGITYSWTGPNSFTSTLASPTIPNISAVNAGTYSLTAGNTCGGVVDNFSDGNYTSNPTWTVQSGGFLTSSFLRGDNSATDDLIYTPSGQAYGSWQFDFTFQTTANRDGNPQVIRFYVLSSENNLNNTNGYYFYYDSSGNIQFIRRTGLSTSTIFSAITAVPCLCSQTVKITRNASGVFELFLNSVSLGTITDNTYTSSNYIGIWNTGSWASDNHTIDNITCAASLVLSTTISVNASPTITSQSSNAQTLCLNSTPTALSISVSAGSGTISKYEWYSNTSNSTSGGTLVATYTTSATTNSYTPVATAIGILYYYVIITNSNGCALTSAVSGAISVGGASTTWNGTTWSNGTPSISNGTNAVINANYNTGTNGSITACSCTVNSGKTLTVGIGTFVTLQNQLTNLDTGNTNINFEDTSCLVQINDTPTTANSGVINYKRKVSGLKGYDYIYWSSPVSGQTVEGLYSSTSPGFKYYWNPTINNSNGASGNISQGNWISASGAMTIGKGYIVRASSSYGWTGNLTSVFTGVPNNGVINIPIARGSNVASLEDNWNFIGNPYPTAVKALDFLTYNTNIQGAIYLWTHTSAPTSSTSPYYGYYTYNYFDDYIVYNGTGTTTGPTTSGLSFNGYIAAGQGFFINMVDGTADNTQTVQFKNSMRYVSGSTTNYNNTQFYRMSPLVENNREKHRIWLDLVDKNNASTRTLLGYVEGATLDKDRMYDAYNNFGDNNAIYTLTQGVTLNIQGRPLPFDDNDQVPLGVCITQTGNYTIAIAAVDGLFENNGKTIYLKDNYLGVIHNLSQEPYRFTQAKGLINDRFQIVYKNPSLGTTEINSNGVVMYEDNQTIYIHSGNSTMSSIKVFDILGRLLKVKNNVLSNDTNIPLENVANQVVLVQITDDLGKITTRKLIIK